MANRMIKRLITAIVLLTLSGAALVAAAQTHGEVRVITVHSDGLAGTVTEENPNRRVSVYLPPRYELARHKRYPVVYLLHGIAGTDQDWTGGRGSWAHIQSVMDQLIADDKIREMIVVMPDASSNFAGSFYVNSASTGDWEDFIAEDLVAHIDANFRTIATRESRGVAGHSMGGYGAIRMGERRADIFSSIFALSPGVVGMTDDITDENRAYIDALEAESFSDLFQPTDNDPGGFWKATLYAVARAFSPNPDKPPFFADLPYQMEGGTLAKNDGAYAAWLSMMPLETAAENVEALKSLSAIWIETGYNDQYTHIPVTTRAYSHKLNELGRRASVRRV